MNIKIRVCQIIGPAAAGSAGPVPTALWESPVCQLSVQGSKVRVRVVLYRRELRGRTAAHNVVTGLLIIFDPFSDEAGFKASCAYHRHRISSVRTPDTTICSVIYLNIHLFITNVLRWCTNTTGAW